MATFVILVYSSDAESPKIYGVFRLADKAEQALADWRQSRRPGDGLRAYVLPVLSVAEMPPPDPLGDAGVRDQHGGRLIQRRKRRPPAGPVVPPPPSGPKLV